MKNTGEEIVENFDRGIKEIKQDTRDKWFMLSSRDQVRHEIKIIHGIGVYGLSKTLGNIILGRSLISKK